MNRKISKLLALLLVFVLAFSLTGCAGGDYKKAVAAFDSGDYDKAQKMFEALGDYKDSADKVTECDYQLALEALNSKDYEAAAFMFEALGSYKDSQKQLEIANYSLMSERLIGEWACEDLDFIDVIVSSIISELDALDIVSREEFFQFFPIENFLLTQIVEFSADGSYSLTVTEESLEEAIDSLSVVLRSGLTDFMSYILSCELEAQGITFETLAAYYGTSDVEELLAILLDMDMDSFYEAAFAELLSTDTESFSSYGTYEIEEGKIVVHTEGNNEIVEFDLKNDTLTFTGEGLDLTGVDDAMLEFIEDSYPQVYSRW